MDRDVRDMRDMIVGLLLALAVIVAGIVATVVAAADGDTGYPGPHTCLEDEAQYVTPDGLACIPVDDTNIEEVTR